MRQKIVAGNWKMNKTLDEGTALISEVTNMVNDEVPSDVQIVLATPFIHLTVARKMIESYPNIALGAQNCSDKASGAYTGEISAAMLKSAGVSFVILGHSERRQYFSETNGQLAEKVNLVLQNGMRPIFCCGESLDQRESGVHIDFVRQQITESLFHLDTKELEKVVIAYEPIWAIGTGKTASSEQAQEMHREIRQHLTGKYGKEVADRISILYGGSANPGNARDLFARPDVDGGLIGGASLKSRDFTDIAKSFS
jgi:triosephosphate isomerase (TIM)